MQNYTKLQQEAAKTILKRKAARENLLDFTRFLFPNYRIAHHHKKIAQKLEQIESGNLKRLMIFMPPRHGKSELASIRFPAWVLGRDPKKSFISASYNMELASDFGRNVRNILSDPEYQTLFQTQLAKNSAAAHRWHTHQGGSYIAAGIGTAVTGRGAHILLIDDPVKDREQANSELIQKKVYEWYTSTAYTRLERSFQDKEKKTDPIWELPAAQKEEKLVPFEGAIVLIQTRWHEKDLAGRLIEDMKNGGDQWEILELPAISKNKALWPEKYPLPTLLEIKKAIGTRDFNALYQQNPTPEEGAYFKRKWFRFYQKIPENLKIYGASDYAVTEKSGDYTVHLVVGVDEKGNIFLLDCWRGQTEPDQWIETLLDLAENWKPLIWAEEKGQIIKSIGAFLNKRMAERKVWFLRKGFASTREKTTRARAIQARAAMGKLYLPDAKLWASDLLEELLSFPNGKNDDQADTLALLGRMLDLMTNPPKQKINNTPLFPLQEEGNHIRSSLTIQQLINKNAKRNKED